MLRRLKCLVGWENASRKRVHNSVSPKQSPSSAAVHALFRPPDMWETAHEISVYIHRFHNLDLFQQGWYQLKISVRWEDSGLVSRGIPARVVQYEAPDGVLDDTLGIWRIDDVDHSFFTQPFRIKYARQDIYLSVLVSFNVFMSQDEGPSTSSLILKFELIYSPLLESGSDLQDSADASPAAVHEFRIPQKALLGLHSYCPVHFDALHAVLVDLSLHVVYGKSGTATSSMKLVNQGWSSKSHEIIKALLTSKEILLEELRKMSEAIGQAIEDLNGADLTLGKYESVESLKSGSPRLSTGASPMKMGVGQLAGILHNFLEKPDGLADYGNSIVLDSLSKEDLGSVFLTVSSQVSFVWNAFLKFHRINRVKVLDYLRDLWAINRKTEWSIWTIHSKIEVPHRYLRSGSDESSLRNSSGKAADDPGQSAASRAELHRKSIAQMKINTRSVQDMQIYGNPSHIPVVLIEQHIMEVPKHGSHNSSPEQNDTIVLPGKEGQIVIPKFVIGKGGRVLRAVVFVHGFQGHHLDLRLVRNQWLMLDPGAECLMSEANEERTSGCFKEMGTRLANEVVSFLKKKIDRLSRYGGCKEVKLSFVGHSIGNVIIRTALAESVMEPYLKNLQTYMSVSGPHLGYWYSSNSLFNSGLWFLKKLKGAHCIHQLTFSDDQDLQNTFLYKLCKMKTLENFKNIILLSSPQDGYVPYHSARIELCQASSSDSSKKAEVFTEMLNNCLDQIRAPTSDRRMFMRCDVNFDMSTQGRNLNTMIGRAAHIEFLETDTYAKFIMWSFPELFR